MAATPPLPRTPRPALLALALLPLALLTPATAQDAEGDPDAPVTSDGDFDRLMGAFSDPLLGGSARETQEAQDAGDARRAPTPAAPDAFTSMPAPEGPRPYPYAVLGVQPGGLPEEVQAALEAELGRPIELEAETVQVRVAAPDGRAFETAYVTELASPYDPAQGLAELADRSAPREPYERFWLGLATPALEGRVTSLTRSLHRPSAEIPQPVALRAQLEGLYGPPSRVEQTPDRLEMVWAWGEEGFIADLEGQPVRAVEHEAAPGEVHAIEHRPCVADPAAARADGAFRHPREKPIWPGCVAVYRVAYGAEIGSATLTTSLADHALARADRLEADRQIVERLLGESAVPAVPSEPPL